MEHGRGLNNLFQNASLLMCFFTFATGHFKTLKAQYVGNAIELLYKIKKSPDHSRSKRN